MDRRQDRPEHLLGQKQVAEIRAAEPAAGQAVATLLDRPRVDAVRGIAKFDISFIRKTSCVAAIAGRHHAVEEIDPGGDGVEDVLRAADAHQVARPVLGQKVGRDGEGLADLVAPLADADAADGVAVEIEGQQGLGALGAEVGVRPPLNDPEERLIGAACAPPCSAPAQAIVRPTASAISSCEAGSAGQWSRHMATSAPSASWIAMARSGVSSSSRPSRCERKVTPVVGHPVPVRQAEDLEPARIGQDRAVPAHERVQPAECRHHLLARPQGQMIGVGQQHPRPGGAELVGREPLDRRLGADRHERRGLDRPVPRLQQAEPRRGARVHGQGGEPNRRATRSGRSRSARGQARFPRSVRPRSEADPADSRPRPDGFGRDCCRCQSFFSFKLSEVSLSRTSLSEVTPKFLHSSSSSPVCLSRSPTVWMLSLLMHLRARTERLRSPIGLFRIACSSGGTSWGCSIAVVVARRARCLRATCPGAGPWPASSP